MTKRIGRPPRTTEGASDHKIGFRVSQTEYKRIQNQAEKAGLTLAEYVRARSLVK